jgi:hypothetical protein
VISKSKTIKKTENNSHSENSELSRVVDWIGTNAMSPELILLLLIQVQQVIVVLSMQSCALTTITARREYKQAFRRQDE